MFECSEETLDYVITWNIIIAVYRPWWKVIINDYYAYFYLVYLESC